MYLWAKVGLKFHLFFFLKYISLIPINHKEPQTQQNPKPNKEQKLQNAFTLLMF